jgi:argininosuccinate synthase
VNTPIVLAYSGSDETTLAVAWLRETHGAEVVALSVDLGDGVPLEALRDRALAAGAVRAHVLDLREELAREYLHRPQAQDSHGRPFVRELAWPLIARTLVDIARIEGAAAVAHGAADTALDTLITTLRPNLRVLAPVRERQRRADARPAHARRVHLNLWGRVVEEPSTAAPVSPARSRAQAESEAAHLEIGFERGLPVSVSGVPMTPVEILESLSTIAGQYAVGRAAADRADAAGDTRVCYEVPAGATLQAARVALEQAVGSTDLEPGDVNIRQGYGRLLADGGWFSPRRIALDALAAPLEQQLSGVVRLKVAAGELSVVDVRAGAASPNVLAGRDLQLVEPA